MLSFSREQITLSAPALTYSPRSGMIAATFFFNCSYVHNTPAKLELNLLMQTSLTRLRRLGLVSVALIEGYAIGGGAEIATSTDFRVMASQEKSYIRFIHNSLSLCPGWGGASRLTQIIGRKAALRVLLEAEKLSATKAHELGLVDDIVTGDGMAEAKRFLFEFTLYDPTSSQSIKRMVASRRGAEGER